MNRPRNRQPRQNNNSQKRAPRDPRHNTLSHVPTSQQVIPGASVSIVLKADQPTGKETQGVVKDLLTRGDHPRGIKVRLQDGQIGRVQRIGTGNSSTASPVVRSSSDLLPKSTPGTGRPGVRDETGRYEGPPSRTLADFIPGLDEVEKSTIGLGEQAKFSYATVKCPICGVFEGDEAAVSHHVEEHLRLEATD